MSNLYLSANDYSFVIDQILSVVAILAAVVAIIGLIVYLCSYMLSGIAYTKLSKRRGREHAYLAWIPLVRYYLFGKIADEIDRDYGKNKGRGPTLLILSVITTIGAVASLLLFCPTCVALLGSMQSIVEYAIVGDGGALETFITPMIATYAIPTLISFVVFFLTAAVAIWKLIVTILSWYRVFKEYAGSRVTVYTLLSTIGTILFGLEFLAPIFILLCYKNTPNKELNDQFYGYPTTAPATPVSSDPPVNPVPTQAAPQAAPPQSEETSESRIEQE